MQVDRQERTVTPPVGRDARRIISDFARRRNAIEIKRNPLFHGRLKITRLVKFKLRGRKFIARNTRSNQRQNSLSGCGYCIGGGHAVRQSFPALGRSFSRTSPPFPAVCGATFWPNWVS